MTLFTLGERLDSPICYTTHHQSTQSTQCYKLQKSNVSDSNIFFGIEGLREKKELEGEELQIVWLEIFFPDNDF